MRTWVTLAATALVAGPAAAFYFPGWPADGLPRPPNLYEYQVSVGPADVFTDTRFSQPPGGASATPPRTVPEPATLLLAAMGLATVLVRRRPA